MPCYSPIHGYYSSQFNENGKRPVVFSSKDGYYDLPITIPCGYCIGCRLDRARQWTIRCLHEADQYDDNSFVTLTYSSAPSSLVPEHMTLFLKRLRKATGQKIRYLQVGEYGENFGRPHHHILFFGYRPHDCQLVVGTQYYHSDFLEKLWGHGFVTVGDITSDSIAYCCRYTLKKLGVDKSKYCGRTPEYITMSRRPGIGQSWFDKYHTDLYSAGTVLLNGIEVKAPRYYDDKLGLIDAKILLDIKKQRLDNMIYKEPTENYISSQVAKIRMARKKRRVENGCSSD